MLLKRLRWHEFQNELNVISAQHTVGLYWVPSHPEVRGNEIADQLARGSSIQKSNGPEPSLGVSRQNIKNNINPGWITSIW
jgi:ribonuclease HI